MTSDEPRHPEPGPNENLEEILVEESDVESEIEAAPSQKIRSANWLRSVRNLWIVIGGLTFLLIVSMLMSRAPVSVPAPEGSPELAAMRAELEARRAELNRQRAELNLPPLAAQGENVDEITSRIRKDTETLISLMERYRKTAEDKDRLLTEKNISLIRSEQIRESLTAELARAHASTADSSQAQAELSTALARANRLADELAIAREMITDLSAPQDTSELESLRQRLEEANRARDFFEQRAMALEKAMVTPEQPGLPENDGE